MNLNKTYYDADGNEVNILQLVKKEPEWAANVIQSLKEREKNHRKLIEELKDFTIWMTGCGYDFCQHEYFNKKRDKLLLGNDTD